MVFVFLRALSGETRSIDAPATVSELRSLVADQSGVSVDSLRLTTATRDLTDDELLSVEENSTLYAHLRLLGGGKKRKKKTYTKPKKIKHKHKNIPLHALKYYKVNDDGTIERLRRECPEPMCGAGVFMAKHKGRQYCGKCGLTYIDEK